MADDPYVIPGTGGVLKNLPGYQTHEELRSWEHLCTTQAAQAVPTVELNPEGLQAIHRHLFEDVYAWAGEFREGNYVKSEGFSKFAPDVEVASNLEALFDQIRASPTNQSIAEAADRLGEHFAALNYNHPFREGNGRTQRLMMEQVASSQGHVPDFRPITGARMYDASIETHHGRLDDMRHLFLDALDPVRRQQLTVAQNIMEAGSYDRDHINNMVFQTALPGQTLHGQLVFMQPNSAAVLIEGTDARIAVGHPLDVVAKSNELGVGAELAQSEVGRRHATAELVPHLDVGDARQMREPDRITEGVPQLAVPDVKHIPELAAAIDQLSAIREGMQTELNAVPQKAFAVAVGEVQNAIRVGGDVHEVTLDRVMHQHRQSATKDRGPSIDL